MVRVWQRIGTNSLLAMAAVAVLGTTAGAQAQDEPERFEFRNDARISLHHFLITWAAVEAGDWPFFAVPLAEHGYWRVELDDVEERIWSEAVAAYDRTRGRSLLFDTGLLAVRARLAREETQVPAPDRGLIEAVEAALPVYRRHWWPEHRRWNQAWIEAVAATVAAIEDEVVPALTAAYGGEWPDRPLPVDVVPYSNPVGAYSTDGWVTLSSVDPALTMPNAVELVFHESSHAESMEAPLRSAIRSAYEAVGAPSSDRLWHDMIFYTTGEVVRIAFEAHGQPGYEHYGHVTGVYRRGERWKDELPALHKHWRPLLGSDTVEYAGSRAAIEAVVRELTGGDG